MFLQAAVEVPQYFGVSLLVEGAHIRHPLSIRTKTFIRSHYESLHKSRHVLQPHKCPSGKENQYKEKKKIKTWPLISPQKVTMERSLTLQPLMEPRRPRVTLPSSSGPLPNPSAHNNLHTSHTHTQLHSGPTHTSFHRTHRHMLSLNRLEPSIEIISLQPTISYKGFYNQNTHSSLTHTVHVSHPVTRTHQYYSLLQRRNTETHRNKTHATTRDLMSQIEK